MKDHIEAGTTPAATPAGPPGSAPHGLGTAKPIIQVIAYGPDDYIEKNFDDPDDVKPLLDKFAVTWVNIDGPIGRDTLDKIGTIFGLHQLALEDVEKANQRVKLEQYDDHFFIVTHMVSLTKRVETEQMSLFFGKNFVLTFQEKAGGDCLNSVRERLRKKTSALRSKKSDYLVYVLLDALIDGYMPILAALEDRLEDLEDQISQSFDLKMLSRIKTIKRDIKLLRRKIRPLREVTNQLIRDGGDLVSEEAAIHLRDCYDHVVRGIEDVEGQREECTDLRDLYMVSISNRLGEVMKVLTIITVIFTPPIFIAGIYGMNFNPDKSPWNMPELNWMFGYPFALALMVILDVGLLWFLYRKGFLGRFDRPDRKGKKDDV